jgi:uncharacterized membrane protein YoaK (UPF0700 family)
MQADPGNAGLRLALGLAFVGGYCDAASFMLVRTFTGHVTGNFVLAATKVVTFDWRGALDALLAISFFLAGIFLCVVITKRLATHSSRFIFQMTMGVEMALIVAAYLALTKISSLGTEMYVAGLSLAMGLQNGALRRANGISVHTTYLTGMITTLIIGHSGGEPMSAGAAPMSERSPGWRVLGGIWLFFVCGALTGALIVSQFKETGILGAVLLLVLILVGTSRLAGRRPSGGELE